MHIQEAVYGLSRLYIHIHTYICVDMHVITINKKVMDLNESKEWYIEDLKA